MSTVSAVSDITEAFLAGMNNWTVQMAQSQLPITEDERFDKPVPGILTLEPEQGYKITVSAKVHFWLGCS